MFEKSLSDLVRGIRNNKKNEGQYISQALQEIRQELRNVNPAVKAVAVQKLCYVRRGAGRGARARARGGGLPGGARGGG